jgi:acyl-CoA hydrolase
VSGTASAIDFTGLIRDGDVVVCGQATAEPRTLTEALAAQAAALPPFKVMIGPLYSATFSDVAANVAFISYGVIGNARKLAREGRLDLIPSGYRAFCADVAFGHHRADVVLVQLAEDGNGRLSASLSNDYLIDAAWRARLVIAEINPDAPWTFGAEWPDAMPIHRRVSTIGPPLELAANEPDDVSRKIAGHAAAPIEDGSTLQFGVGRIPQAILSSLGHARDLGIHSGLINDQVVELIARGVITNARKVSTPASSSPTS